MRSRSVGRLSKYPRVSCLGIALSVAGGCAELIGLLLTVLGIADSRRQARDLGLDRQVHELSSAVDLSGSGSLTVGDLSGGREPTTEERIAGLEARLDGLASEARERDVQLRKQTRVDIHEAVGTARQQAQEQDRTLRKFIHAMLTGSLGRQAYGVTLFAIGVVLSVAADVVG